jgi:hypothetical protein
MLRGQIALPARDGLTNVKAGTETRAASTFSEVARFLHPSVFVSEWATGSASIIEARPAFKELGSTHTESSHVPPGGIRITADADGSLSFSGGAGLATPCYVTIVDGVCLFSWQLQDMFDCGALKSIDVERIQEYLRGDERYTSDTIFPSVKLLTERSTLVVRDGEITVTLPEDSTWLRPKQLKAGVDIVGVYGQLLARTLSPLAERKDAVICELSGGYDSATVCLAASQSLGRGLRSYGLIFPREAASPQVRRRQSVIDLAGLVDTARPAASVTFLEHWLSPHTFIDPYTEIYELMVRAALSDVPGMHENSVVVTGIGGDELFSRSRESGPPPTDHGAEQSNHHTVPSVPETSLQSCLARAGMFMKLGMLAYNPFIDPDVVAFSQRLGNEWKSDRRIQHEFMLRCGVPPHLMHRRSPENFEAVFREELRRVMVSGLDLRDPCTVDLGIISRDEWASSMADEPWRQPRQRLNFSFRLILIELMMRLISA